MNDVLKPRYRKDKDLKIKLVSHKFFEVFSQKYPKNKIDDYSKMREVLKCFHEEVTDVISTEREGFDLMNIAYLITVGYEPEDNVLQEGKKYINQKLTNEYGKVIPYLNLDTDGKFCKIFVSMELPKYKFKYKKSWGFTACRPFKKKVSIEFKKNYNRFIVLDKEEPYRKIFSLVS